MDFLVSLHSWYRWVVLPVLAVGGLAGIVQAVRAAAWTPSYLSVMRTEAVVFDIGVALGIVVWLGTSAWDGSLGFAVVHPVGMLIALGIVHLSMARARQIANRASYRVSGLGSLVALAVAIALIPW